MTRYTVRAPDGKTLVIDGPPGASQDDVLAQAQQLYRPTLRTQTAPAPAPTPPQLALTDARARQGSVPAQVRAFTNGSTLGLANLVDAAGAAGETGLYNLTHPGQAKYGMTDAFNAVRQASHDADAKFGQDHPLQAGGIGLLGALATPGLGALAEGVGGALQTVRNPVLRAIASGVAGAATGAPLGAINGAATAAPGQEMQGAQNGAVAGGVTGGLAPGAAYVGGKLVQGGMNAAQTVARAANKATGGQILNASRVAAQRLADAMKADKIDPDTARTIMGQWLKTGVTPSLLDVVPQGGRTQALIRGSAMTGDARQVARQYAAKVAADTQDNALALTRKLTPDNTQTAAQHQADLTAARAAQAKTEYEAPYAQQVPADPILPVLGGPSGGAASGTAYLDAEANKLNPTIADRLPELAALKGALAPETTVDPLAQSSVSDLPPELQSLFGGSEQQSGPLTVSLGTLDRLKIALNHMGETEMNGPRPNPTRAQGYFDLAGHIDDHLANNSDLYATARDNYAANSRPIDAVQLGSTALQPGTNPTDYTRTLQALGANAQPSAQVGLRSALEQSIGAPADGSTGFLNRVATGTNPTQILNATFDPDTTANYQSGLSNLITKLQNARKIDQSSGSDTASRLIDAQAVNDIPKIPKSVGALVGTLWDKIQSGATLTDAEKQAIAQMGTSDAPSMLQQLNVQPSYPAQVDDWLTKYLPTVAGRGGLLGAATFSNQTNQ